MKLVVFFGEAKNKLFFLFHTIFFTLGYSLTHIYSHPDTTQFAFGISLSLSFSLSLSQLSLSASQVQEIDKMESLFDLLFQHALAFTFAHPPTHNHTQTHT